MTTRLSIYSHQGIKLTEVVANFKRTWKIGEYGEAQFTLATADAKAKLEYLQFGNLVYAEHDKLPPWGGMIDTPRTWDVKAITVHCYGGEYLFTQRHAPRELIIKGAPGVIFKALIEQGNVAGDAPITVGEVWGEGATTQMIYHYDMLYDRIKELCKMYEAEWTVTPVIDKSGNGLYFSASFHDQVGQVSQMVLYEDQHIELKGNVLTEQGEIVNEVTAFGGGSTYATILSTTYINEASIGKYGLRRKSYNIGGKDSAAIAAGGQAQLGRSYEPRKTFDINVLDVGDAFNQLRIGVTFPLQLYTIGFTGAEYGMRTNIRVLGMTYDDRANKVSVIADEVV